MSHRNEAEVIEPRDLNPVEQAAYDADLAAVAVRLAAAQATPVNSGRRTTGSVFPSTGSYAGKRRPSIGAPCTGGRQPPTSGTPPTTE